MTSSIRSKTWKIPLLTMINPKLLINPFERIAGGLALGIGLVTNIVAGLIAGNNGTHFPDLLSVLYTVTTGPFVPIAEIFTSTLLLTILGVLAGLICRANFRVIDIVGTIALSRSPYLIMALAGYLSYSGINHQLWSLIIIPILVTCIAWSMILFYHALQVSLNLKGKTLWISFATTAILSEILAILLMKKVYLFIL